MKSRLTGTKLNLSFDADSSELEDKIQEIQDAIEALNDGYRGVEMTGRRI